MHQPGAIEPSPMTSRDLLYWLLGVFDLFGPAALDKHRGADDAVVLSIRDHAQKVLDRAPEDVFARSVHALAARPEALYDLVRALSVPVAKPAVPQLPEDEAFRKAWEEFQRNGKTATWLGSTVVYC